MFNDYRKLIQLYGNTKSKNEIATIMRCKWETVRDAIRRLEDVWGSLDSIPRDLSNEDIARALRNSSKNSSDYLPIDYDECLNQLRKGKSKTEIWDDYIKEAEKAEKQGYKMSRFNELLNDYSSTKDIPARFERVPGIKGEIDWVGDKAHLIDDKTGELTDVHILVIALPYSGYFYAEGFIDEKIDSFLQGHKHAFEFFGGVPLVLVPDNCKTAVTKGRYKSDDGFVLNEKYKALADHYGVSVMPARVRKPKDKSVVERTVQILEKDILPELDALDIYTLEEFNMLLLKKVERRLKRPYTKRYGSRESIFLEEEKQSLQPLPAFEFQCYSEKIAAVGRDSYIQYQKAFYSVAAPYIGQNVIVREYDGRLYIYNNSRDLIATHNKALKEWSRVTDDSHLRYDISRYGGFSEKEFIVKASRFGEPMVEWTRMVLSSRQHVSHSFRTLVGVFAKLDGYPSDSICIAASTAQRQRITSAKGFLAILRFQNERTSSIPDDVYISRS